MDTESTSSTNISTYPRIIWNLPVARTSACPRCRSTSHLKPITARVPYFDTEKLIPMKDTQLLSICTDCRLPFLYLPFGHENDLYLKRRLYSTIDAASFASTKFSTEEHRARMFSIKDFIAYFKNTDVLLTNTRGSCLHFLVISDTYECETIPGLIWNLPRTLPDKGACPVCGRHNAVYHRMATIVGRAYSENVLCSADVRYCTDCLIAFGDLCPTENPFEELFGSRLSFSQFSVDAAYTSRSDLLTAVRSKISSPAIYTRIMRIDKSNTLTIRRNFVPTSHGHIVNTLPQREK